MPVFSLLEHFPVNSEKIQCMVHFQGQSDLVEFFPKEQFFKTMYSLRIICELLPEENQDDQGTFTIDSRLLTEKEKALWTMKIGANGGMDILVELFEKCCVLSNKRKERINFGLSI